MIESRAEICPDCRETRDRDWIVRSITRGAPIPPGFRVLKRIGAWKTIARPTRSTTLCLCDAP